MNMGEIYLDTHLSLQQIFENMLVDIGKVLHPAGNITPHRKEPIKQYHTSIKSFTI